MSPLIIQTGKNPRVKCADDTLIGEYSINGWVLLENNLDCLIFLSGHSPMKYILRHPNMKQDIWEEQMQIIPLR